jgi:ABC-type transporter Mla subunit MlaD
MSLARRLARQQAKGGRQQLDQALGKITKAAEQAQSINDVLSALPRQVMETRQLLDTLLEDYQILADELEVTQYILRRSASLTPEQEKGYRADYQEKKDRSG